MVCSRTTYCAGAYRLQPMRSAMRHGSEGYQSDQG